MKKQNATLINKHICLKVKLDILVRTGQALLCDIRSMEKEKKSHHLHGVDEWCINCE